MAEMPDQTTLDSELEEKMISLRQEIRKKRAELSDKDRALLTELFFVPSKDLASRLAEASLEVREVDRLMRGLVELDAQKDFPGIP